MVPVCRCLGERPLPQAAACIFHSLLLHPFSWCCCCFSCGCGCYYVFTTTITILIIVITILITVVVVVVVVVGRRRVCRAGLQCARTRVLARRSLDKKSAVRLSHRFFCSALLEKAKISRSLQIRMSFRSDFRGVAAAPVIEMGFSVGCFQRQGLQKRRGSRFLSLAAGRDKALISTGPLSLPAARDKKLEPRLLFRPPRHYNNHPPYTAVPCQVSTLF